MKDIGQFANNNISRNLLRCTALLKVILMLNIWLATESHILIPQSKNLSQEKASSPLKSYNGSELSTAPKRVNKTSVKSTSIVEEELRYLMFKALDIDPYKDHFNQKSDSIPPLMLRIWELENSFHILSQSGDLKYDDKKKLLLERDFNISKILDSSDGSKDDNSTYIDFKGSRFYALIYDFIMSSDYYKPDEIQINDVINSSEVSYHPESIRHFTNVVLPVLDSIIASKPLSITNLKSSTIDLQYQVKGVQAKNLIWVELVLHRKLKINGLEKDSPNDSKINPIQTLVCTNYQDHLMNNNTVACTITELVFESSDVFIFINLSQVNLVNYTQNPNIRIFISIHKLWDSEQVSLYDLYDFNINSKYAPFLLLYRKSSIIKKQNLMQPNKMRSKRRITPAKDSMCQLHEWYIDFSTLGWDDWFVKPNGYFINFCGGTCVSPLLNEIYNASMHSLIKDLWILATNGKGKPVNRAGYITNIPKASCVPIEYEPLSVLYIEDSNIVLKHLDGMSASRCGCR